MNDSFTQRMLERARERQKKLDEHYNIAGETSKKPLQDTNQLLNKLESANMTKSQPNLTDCPKIKPKDISSDTNINKKSLHSSHFKENLSDPNLARISKSGNTLVSTESSPKSPTKTLNIQQENFNMEIKLTSSENVRVEVEIEERNKSDNDDNNEVFPGIYKLNNKEKEFESTDDAPLRKDAKKRLQRLGKLYSGEDEALSSPIHRSEENVEDMIEKENNKPTIVGLGRLKKLADIRNEWEDDITLSSSNIPKKDVPKRSWKQPAPKPPVITVSSPKKYQAPKPPVNVHNFTKIPSRDPSPEKTSNIPRSPVKSGQRSPIKERPISGTKQLAWDQAVIETLESQGFTRTDSNAHLVYNYKEPEKTNVDKSETIEENEEIIEENKTEPKAISKISSKFIENESKQEKPKSPMFKPKSPTKNNEISNRVAMFEQGSPTKTKDPALLSVSERKALFEKNKGTVLVPKAAFGMPAPAKTTEKEKTTIPQVKPATPVKSTSVLQKLMRKEPSSPVKTPIKGNEDSPATQGIKQASGIAGRMKALLEKKTTIAEAQIDNKIKEQRQKEMNVLLNRFNKQKDVDDDIIEEVHEELSESEEEDIENISETTKMIAAKAAKIKTFKGSSNSLSSIPPPPPPPPQPKTGAPKRRSKGDSPKVRQVLDDVKRIRVSPPKAGRMYPNLSDIEASTENEMETRSPSPDSSYEENTSYVDSDGPNTSFGRDILQTICKNQTPHKRPSMDDSDVSDVLQEVLEYLNEEDSECSTEGPTPPKIGKHSPQRHVAAPSFSFNYKDCSPVKKSPTKKIMSPLRETLTDSSEDNLPTIIIDGNAELPLTHSVSFYRKQQAQSSTTPMRKIQRQPAIEEIEDEENDSMPDGKLEVQNKIQELLEDVSKQQTVISQASQALNLCISTIEFSGSSEQVEAERLLLVATQRRQAALHEIQRLRVEGTLHPGKNNCVDKGTLTISNICLPLKKEYARALSSAGGLGHHIFCLLRYAEHVMPTRIASTQASPRENLEMNLYIPGSVKLFDVYADFTATIEVYTLQAQEEVLPHEVKYHIATKKGGKSTPKKIKNDSKLIRPTIQSPAGPQAVRSPSFSLVGYVVFSLQGISRTQWTLNNTPSMSPLEGNIHMKIKCELDISVEHRGFLSMFDDVSGFGAWHRRWCLLKGNTISYWKYPDDEKKKASIETLTLLNCRTKQVGPVTREICARPNTFLLETVRQAKSTDIDSLVTVCQGDKTIIRHLLSADTKEERSQWCEQLNKALRAIRFVTNAK